MINLILALVSMLLVVNLTLALQARYQQRVPRADRKEFNEYIVTLKREQAEKIVMKEYTDAVQEAIKAYTSCKN